MNVNVRTSSGTALHEAALCGKTEVVRTLLENGIDLNIRDAKNNTVIEVLKQFPGHVVRDIYSLIKSELPNVAEGQGGTSDMKPKYQLRLRIKLKPNASNN